jgi:hypothetical protein
VDITNEYVYHYLLKKINKSRMNETAPQSELFKLLDEADRLDGYVTACNNSPINKAARENNQYVPWNDQSLAKKAEGLMPGKNAKVIILTPSAEGGMPHTRAPNIICLPAYFPDSVLLKTLEHELVHIDQKQNPEKWRKKALDEGWIPVSEFDLPEVWLNRCRLNPDTYDARFWGWEGRHVPMPLYIREDRPKLREIVVRWWDLQDNKLNNDEPDSFIKKYGKLEASSAEHPFELWAYH